MLHLKTFGGLSVAAETASARGAAQHRKTLALLALLAAARRRGMSRDKLIAYLWPDADTEHGRNLLNQACYTLRRDLHAPELFLGATELRLNPENISSDLQNFEEALDGGDPAGALPVLDERRSGGGEVIAHGHRSSFPGFRMPRRSEEHTSELQSQSNLVCRLLLEKKK